MIACIPSTTDYEVDPATGALKVPLYGGTYSGLFALVDPADIERVAVHRWRPQKAKMGKFYAVASVCERGRCVVIGMHRLILGIEDPAIQVDHENHDGLDNRRCNLRPASHQQNNLNRRPRMGTTSRYKGVSWTTRRQKWCAQIEVDKRNRHIGYFLSEEEAARAYDRVALEVFGEYAYLNFPDHAILREVR